MRVMSSNHDSIEPPHSRLFVLCSKSITQEELRTSFDSYGHIEDIWIVKDKATGEAKGVVYIKFSKSSSAALAVEEMHGKCIDSSQKAIKVMVAHNREQGAKKDDDMERLVRLFIVVPRSATEEEIRTQFEEYGKIESVNIVKNRDTGESKGFAYVKFMRPYSAALAFEDCPKTYKAVFARPREQKQNHSVYENPYDRMSSPAGGGNNWGGYGGNDPPESCRLVAMVPPMLREAQVFRLFDLVPGLQLCRPLQDTRNYHQQYLRVLVQYSSQQGLSHALEKLNGFEYPPGHRVSVKPASSQDGGGIGGYGGGGGGGGGGNMGRGGGDMSSSNHGGGGSQSSGQGQGQGQGTTTILTTDLVQLKSMLAQAESVIKAAGLTQGGMMDHTDANYCSVALPPPKPLATKTSDTPAERLFIVCQPGLPPMYALRDVFGRFGDLTDLYVLNGKNCGYVSYASQEAAQKAIETLHQQEVCGMRLKVMKAEPPRGGPNERKRIRMDTEDN